MADSSSRNINGTEGSQQQKQDQQYGHRFQINSKYCNEGFTSDVRSCLEGNHQNSLPFPHFSLSNFISDAASDSCSLLETLRLELNSARWHRKSNDLYALNQTADLQGFDSTKFPALHAFRKFLVERVRHWLQEISGVELNSKVALTGSRYDQTDILLPHDDRLEKRAFAFVFYLSPDWLEEYGGNLLLYDADAERNRPANIAKSIPPIENSFLLFRVQQNSWHSVAEVLAKDKSRLSLNGWFHSDKVVLAAEPAPECSLPRLSPSLDISLAEVEAWLNPKFVRPIEHKKIKRIFALKSELSLENFLNMDKYKQALEELESSTFDAVGPPDKRKVGRLDESKVSKESAVGTLLRLFRSEAMTLLLTQWTGLRLCCIESIHSRLKIEVEVKETVRAVNDSMGDCQLQPAAKKMRCDDNKLPANSLPSTSQQDNAAKQSNDIPSDVQIVSCMNRYEHGCYSMADDQLAADAKSNGFCLDVMLFFGTSSEWDVNQGGFLSYFALDDTEEILRVPPSLNTAAIVFREPEVLNFTKYVNCLAGDKHFYVLNCSFFGVSNEDSESEDSLESDDGSAHPVDLAMEDAELDEDDESPPEDGDEEGLATGSR